MEAWTRFRQYLRGYNSEAYKETMESVEKLASGCFTLLYSKTEDERKETFARSQGLTDQITNVVGAESPMVASLALIMAIRIYEQHVSEQAKTLCEMQ